MHAQVNERACWGLNIHMGENAMSKGAIGIVVMLWVLSLLVVGTIVHAQVYRPTQPVTPRVVAGPEFGFRIEGQQNGIVVGVPVVQIDGKWVPAKIGPMDAQR
jgi:hypothetical protein